MTDQKAKILITGAHFTPAQAVIEQLQKRGFTNLVYVGRQYAQEGDRTQSAESKILPKLGVKYLTLTTGRLQRSFTRYTLPSLLKIPVGIVQALSIVSRERPAVVVSFGGFVGVPMVLAAWLYRIPVLVHVQTLVTGLANKLSAPMATKIAVSFPIKYDFPKDKIVLTGNPIRSELLSKDQEVDPEIKRFVALAKTHRQPLLLVTGGNQGSHIINQTIAELLPGLTEEYFVIHQTGDSKYNDFGQLVAQSTKDNLSDKYLVKKWINASDMKQIFEAADLVIARAGINTLYELAYFSVPVLLIPLPYLYMNEQEVNARYFEKLGLAEVLLQDQLTSELLSKKIELMLQSKHDLTAARQVIIPDATAKIVNLVEEIISQKT